MPELTLYSMPSSGNSYKIRLLLAFLHQPYRHIGLEYGTEELAACHEEGTLPLSRLPVLELPNGTRLPESNAILCYLGEKTDWLPDAPILKAQTLAWMFWEQNQHEATIAVRASLLIYPHRKADATPERLASLLNAGEIVLGQMEAHLSGQEWLVGDSPTLADIALFAYTHSAETRGGFELAKFPRIMDWLARFSALPNFVTLDEIPE